MQTIRKVALILSLTLLLMGTAFLLVPVMQENAALIARVLLSCGMFGLILSAGLSSGKRYSPAVARFGKQTVLAEEEKIGFDDVAANREAKQSMIGLVEYLQNPNRYAQLGARMPRGLLLYGPPGTGKTLLARALAGEAGVPFFALSGSDFVQMYVGVGASRVRELFSKARKAGKCVIFIDEIDALGKRRADAVSEERDQTLNALLSEMSGFHRDEGILVVAATNRPEALDPALLRPGRFDRQIEVGLPGQRERLEILNLHSRNKPLAEDVSLEELSRETCAFSGASLEALLNEAAILAVQRKSEQIEQTDIDRAFYRSVAGEDGIRATTAEERCAIALHEAGHAVVLKKLLPQNRLKRVSILSASHGAAGYNLAIPPERTLSMKKDLENQICVLLAGRAAEVIVGGEEELTAGASNDLSRAAELTGSMILDFGMGGDPAVSLRTVGTICNTVAGADRLCREKLDELFQRTGKILEEQIDSLLRLTDALLERETMKEEEIDQVLGQ